MKKCYLCKLEKEESSFTNYHINHIRGRCKECVRKAYIKVYAKHKDKYNAHSKIVQKRTRVTNKKLKIEYLLAHPCVDCGNTDTRVLDFDHLRDKKEKVSKMLSSYTWAKVYEEIEKCEVRCANCHRIKHFKE